MTLLPVRCPQRFFYRFFYRIRVRAGRKGERRSMSEADYAQLVTAAHNQLAARDPVRGQT
jgi:hypothetical protein